MYENKFPEYEIVIKISDSVYEPAEDTFLMIDNIKIQQSTTKLIEIGGGSGIISIALAKKYPDVDFIITDISFNATKLIKENVEINNLEKQIEIVCTDTITSLNIHEKNIIIWNPPYLPQDEQKNMLSKTEQLMYFGGKRGYEAVYEFLNYLKKNQIYTKFYTLFSSKAWKQNYIGEFKFKGFQFKIIAKEKMFFEELVLVELERCNDERQK